MGEDTRKVDEKLISIVKSKPGLYDLRVPAKLRSKVIKESLWKEVSSLLDGEMEPDYAEARWKYLRENYIKSRRKEKMREEIAKRNGLKPYKKRGKHSFRYYEIMEFLNDALDYQKALTAKNVAKARRLTETKLEKNFKSNRPKSKPLTLHEPGVVNQNFKEKEQVQTKLDKNVEFEEITQEIDNEGPIKSPICHLQENSNTDNNCTNKKNGFEEVFLQCLKKPIERPCPIDGFLVRLGEGLRRLPYRERSKLELEFLMRLHEVEELLCDD